MNSSLDEARRLFEQGLEAFNSGNFRAAEFELRKAHAILPDRPSILANLSAALISQQKWVDAEAFCRKLLFLEPNDVEGLINLGTCLAHCENPEGGIEAFNKALHLNPNAHAAWVNKANTLLDMKEMNEALVCFQKALEIDPESQEALIGLSNLCVEQRDYQAGLDYLSELLEINPDNSQAQWNKSLALLRLGQFEEGWKLFESRWNIPGMDEYAQEHATPLWLGQESISGKSILVFAEQGYGDTIQFSRYLPLLEKQYGARVMLGVPKALVQLMQSLSPSIEIFENDARNFQAAELRADFHCPIMSLPLAFKTTLETIPNTTPYLWADPSKSNFWKDRLENITFKRSNAKEKPFRVGITWAGSGHYAGKKNSKRDIPYQEIAKLIRSVSESDFEFHAIANVINDDWLDTSVPVNLFFHQPHLKSFADSATLMTELDFVLSIDTATAHLAGALGKNSTILIPEPPDFMSLIDVNNHPWYPNAKFIRQTNPGVWPIEIISKHLLEEASKH